MGTLPISGLMHEREGGGDPPLLINRENPNVHMVTYTMRLRIILNLTYRIFLFDCDHVNAWKVITFITDFVELSFGDAASRHSRTVCGSHLTCASLGGC